MQLFTTAWRKANTLQRRLRRWGYQRLSPHASTTPVFIMGCARSGSSVTMDLFAHSLDADVYQQVDRRAFQNQMLRPQTVLRDLFVKSRAAVAVLKPMHENQHARRYLDAFPDLRIVWLLRAYGDSVNSCVRRWNSMRGNLQAIAAGDADVGWWGEGLSAHQLEVIRHHYRPEMSEASAYALFWYIRHYFYFDLGLDEVPNVQVFRYETLVSEPESAVEDLFNFCSCPYKPAYARILHASSIRKHPHPEIDPEIEALCQDMTMRFDQHLVKL
ncbi:sulfotransferase domain-containing protein [Candidatus Entotheonella palauensis]|uniref:sulfotransferase domain-containing protein n=1 Tax=Candidatus Entotheonella palauensis TaxID=93172 RepID=UPI000B7F71E1|nr:sulfotransferase domain-containing protein [Candidatus Entotheonella palauensis]